MKKILTVLLYLSSISIGHTQMDKDNKPEIEGWFFRATSGYPAAITFKPLVFFKDGSYLKVGEQPIEDLDIAKSKIEESSSWGKWEQNNNLFKLTDANGKIKTYDLKKGNWFPAFPFETSISLKGNYEKVSGGDYSNGLLALFRSEITFLDDSHFTNSEDGGVSTYASNAWKTSKNSGTYKVYDNTIELQYNQGEKVRLSFAIGAQGDNVIDTDMIFIGGKAYVIE